VRIASQLLSQPCAGYRVNGDAALVRPIDAGFLIGLIDALGHGPRAAEVAERATARLAEVPVKDGVLGVMEDLHRCLEGTRGAAALVLLLRQGRLEGCTVGNVDLRTLGGPVPVVQSPGIVGVRVRRYNIFAADLPTGSRLFLFSDGISSSVPVAETRDMDPAAACRFIFQGFRRAHDDATILVIDVKD
jgi:phosphoserine phosphatase RsbX